MARLKFVSLTLGLVGIVYVTYLRKRRGKCPYLFPTIYNNNKISGKNVTKMAQAFLDKFALNPKYSCFYVDEDTITC